MILLANMKGSFWFLVFGWFWVLLGFTLYSYSQIDLNLTLSSQEVYQNFQKIMTQLGYFNRPLSSFFYFFLVFFLFVFYFIFLKSSEKFGWREYRFLTLLNFFILLFSYPAFSYDIFNYIFDVRILAHYGDNPWVKTALDYPFDPWTRFMHWTHRPYPYGPIWLVVSLAPYFLGFGKFLLTLFSFKLFFALNYLSCSLLIYKISQKLKLQKPSFAFSFFAFNPLVIIESLISPHLDIFMSFLGLFSLFIFLKKRKIVSFLFLFFSILTKYVTLGWLPFVFEKLRWSKRFFLMIIFTSLMIVIQVLFREILPWYFLPFLALISLVKEKFFKFLGLGLSIGGSFYYLPYLYFGDYSHPVKTFRLVIFWLPIFLSLSFYFLKYFKKNEK